MQGEEQDRQEEAGTAPRRRRWRRALLLLLILLLAAVAALWLMRVRLATSWIDRELARRGVQASYEVKRIGFGRQVLENLVIGDPARPDATARRVEVVLRLGLGAPRVGLIRARGVRLFGRVVDGRLTLGQVDRLLPPPSGLPFRLPDQEVDVADAAIALATPAGPLAIGLAGRGNLADGFRGQMALVSRRLRLGDCRLEAPRARASVAVDRLRPHFNGPLALAAIECGEGDFRADRPLFALDARLAPALDAWRGAAAFRSASLAAGPQRLARVGGRMTFDGDAKATEGRLALESGAGSVAQFRARESRFAGRYGLSLESGRLALNGDVGFAGLALAPAAASSLTGALQGLGGTPLGPIGDALAAALRRAVRGGAEASARLALVQQGGEGRVRIVEPRVAARSGARLAGAGGEGISYAWPSGRLRLDGRFTLAGGGFPDAALDLRQATPGGTFDGVARIAPMAAGGARLALAPIRFATGPGGTRFSTSLLADGPIGSGVVRGLSLPLQGRFGPGGLRIGEACLPVAWRAFAIEDLHLGPARLSLCPTGSALLRRDAAGRLAAGGRLASPRFAGRLGASPISLAAAHVDLGLDGASARDLVARLGTGSDPNRLEISRLDAAFVRRGVAGRYSGLSGKLSNVPLLLGEGQGRWQVVGGDLEMAGSVGVSDAMDPPRFYPLGSPDFRLRLADNQVHVTGSLRHPASGRHVADVVIDHDLRRGAGAATLDLVDVAFDSAFQPEALTRLTTGIVALVEGRVTGQGRIEWDSAETRSTGTFSTRDMRLAAPFGPVEGLTTTLNFTDLLALETAPGQVAEVGLVRAGIDVYDGRLVYQLRPDYRVAIEGGRWPYAGGELILQPTLLDFSQPSTKYLTFRVVGLDAARFIELMKFSNISATGIFDGLVPMEFDIGGSRIVGGRVTARPGGGTLSYIGELTDRDLGVYGRMAFDALKSLRYDRFDIRLDGSLDGEFVTNIELDGIARNPGGAVRAPGGAIGQMIVGRVVSQLARIPFEFNIRIQGPFRALIGTARSFEDPSLLIQPVLPRSLRDLPTQVNDVQDEESETQP